MDTNLLDAERSFQDAIHDAGLTPPDQIIFDGQVYRFDSDDKRDKAGWYVAHANANTNRNPGGKFGCWRSGVEVSWYYHRQKGLADAARSASVRDRQRAQEARKKEQEKIHQDAAQRAANIWANTQAAQPDHPYLVRKQIQPHGARIYNNQLVLPVLDFTGKLTSLQFISPTKDPATGRDKTLLKDGRKQGCYIPVAGDPANYSCIIICEGWATGCSLAEDKPSALVVAAIDAGNLRPVALAIRHHWVSATLLIAGDDDRQTPGNPGATKAKAAAIDSDALLALPQWPDDAPEHLTDFNDLAVWLKRSVT